MNSRKGSRINPMRIICFANGFVGWKVVEWLQTHGEELVAVVIHPLERSRFRDEILRATELSNTKIIDGSKLRDPAVVDQIRNLNADIGISAYFGYIFKPELISLFPRGIVNIHPALLPYNRGAHPNVWSIVDKTPAGVTLHSINAGIDTGALISQNEVIVEPIDTGESLYRKLEFAALKLFQETWPQIKEGKENAIPQKLGAGSYHSVKDLEKIARIDLEKNYRAEDLLNLIRARSFTGYSGAFFEIDHRRVNIRIQLEYEEAEK